jgi:hypothetical protein
MILIAHRGNTHGRNKERENKPDYIDEALALGFDVELDVWIKDEQLFLGHDGPETRIDVIFLRERESKLWCHAKNLEALEYLLEHGFHTFSHDVDEYTITSKGYIWAHPKSRFSSKTICVMGKPTPDCLGCVADNFQDPLVYQCTKTYLPLQF